MVTSNTSTVVANEIASIQQSAGRLRRIFGRGRVVDDHVGGGTVLETNFDNVVNVVEDEESNPQEENRDTEQQEEHRWTVFEEDTASTNFSDLFVHVDLSKHVRVGDFVVLVKDPYHGRVGKVVKARGTGYWEVQLEEDGQGTRARVWKMRSNCWKVIAP